MSAIHDSSNARRAYRSELRVAQAHATRERILDAVGTLLRTDPDRLSFAAIAKTARVALPTVNRHFPTRTDLFEAYRLRVEGSSTEEERAITRSSTSIEKMAPHIRAFFRRFDDPADPVFGMRRLRPTLAWEFSREVTVPKRREWAKAIIDANCPGLASIDRQRFSDLLVVLVSSSMGEAMRGYLNRSGKDTADRVNWAVHALLSHAVACASSARAGTALERSPDHARARSPRRGSKS